ncbi:MAG: flagellar hook-basal body complex protein FliE [Betaproteobacteria bacterium]|nr:MAG: flagellar hook-basal body complex protein FliE [Betaproteobacteria bacterium]
MDLTNKVDQLLGQMRAAQGMAAKIGAKLGKEETPEAAKSDFAAVLKASIDQVNATQVEAQSMTQAFEVGAPGVQLHDVMISLSKANVSFQQMVQVRNKLVSAYQDIMNMQV